MIAWILVMLSGLYSFLITLSVLIIRKDYKHAREAREIFTKAYLKVCMEFGDYKRNERKNNG